MSTKFTIRWHPQDGDDPDGVGFHIYQDFLDECAGLDAVHLHMEGVAFEAYSGGTIDITLPRRIAVLLGLIPEIRQKEEE